MEKARGVVRRWTAKLSWRRVSEALWKRRHTYRDDKVKEHSATRSDAYWAWRAAADTRPSGHPDRTEAWAAYTKADELVQKWVELRAEASAKLDERREQVAAAERVLDRWRPKLAASLSVVSHGVIGVYRTGGYGSLGPIRYVTVHHTAGARCSTMDSAIAHIRAYDRQHANQWGGGIGYHEFVDDLGRVYPVRSPSARGAHVGRANTGNYGISLFGNYENMEPTAAALATLRARLTQAPPSGLPDLRGKTVRGHRDWAGHRSNACPGRNLYAHVRQL